MAKSIKRNFLFNILLNISKVIFPLITAPYVSRVLEPDGVGLFNFANTYANWFALSAALGIPYYGIREIAKIRDDKEKQTKFVSEIISLSIISTAFFSILMFLSLMLVPRLNDNYIIFLVASIVLYLTPLRIEWFFSGKEEFGYITFRSLVIKTLSVFLLFILVKTKDDLIKYVALFALSIVANDIWNFIMLYRSGIHPYLTLNIHKHIKPLLILFSSSIAIYVYTALDTLLLGFLTNYKEVGYYNCATHISKAMVPIVTSLATVALPRVAQFKEAHRWAELNELLNMSFSIAGFLSFPIAFIIISVAPIFVPLFFGEQFYGTILPLQIIILTVIAIGYSNLTGIQILLGFGLDKLFLYSILSGTIISFTFDLILIPIFGAVGASISSVFAETVVLSVMIYYIFKYTKIRISKKREVLLNLAIASTFIIISSCVFKMTTGWIAIFVIIVSCSIIYLTLQYICHNSAEKEILRMVKNRIKILWG